MNGANFAAGGQTGTGTGGVSYALTGPSITAFNGPFASGATDPNVGTLLSQFFYGGANRDETLTVSGLTPGRTVTISVLGAAFGAGSTSAREEDLTGIGTGPFTTFPGYEENNGMFSRVDYTDIVPNTGILRFSSHATDSGGDTLHYYAFTVSQSATPEPASAGLFAAAGLSFLARRRREGLIPPGDWPGWKGCPCHGFIPWTIFIVGARESPKISNSSRIPVIDLPFPVPFFLPQAHKGTIARADRRRVCCCHPCHDRCRLRAAGSLACRRLAAAGDQILSR